MFKHIYGCLKALLILAVALGGVSVVLAGLAMADPDVVATAETLDRDLEPVIVTGTQVGAFSGLPTDGVFVYKYSAGDWIQIPFQVDEVTMTGDYTTTEDSVLDANDEIAFMAMDLGGQAPAGDPIAASLPISLPWYEIEITDPMDVAKKGWAYLVRSSTLTPTFTSDYVDYNLGLHLIEGTTYALRLAIPMPYFDYLALNDGDDILDRTKTRLCVFSWWCPVTEDSIPGDVGVKDGLIEDGPVRVIVRDGKGLAYHSTVRWTVPISWRDSWLPTPHIRFSTDFNEKASGATYYNAVAPDGVTVDGEPDAVPEEPVSSWFQLSTGDGTLVQVGDTSSMGGAQYNYYEDNSINPVADTGDGKRYGETGVFVHRPNRSFTYTFALYVLPGTQPNVGATYEDYYVQPLSVTASGTGLTVTLEAAPKSRTVGESSTLTAVVVDYNDDPISGMDVTFTLASGQGTVTPTVATTNPAGQATAFLSSRVANSAVVKAIAHGMDSNTRTITFTPGAMTTVTLEAIPEKVVVGHTSTLSATVADQYGNGISGTVVTFTLVSGQGTLTPTISTTNEDGEAMSSVSSQALGDVEVQATVGSLDSNGRTVSFLRGTYLPVVMKSAT